MSEELPEIEVGQVWQARGGWEYPPIERVDGTFAYLPASEPGALVYFYREKGEDIRGRWALDERSCLDLYKLVKPAPSKIAKGHNPRLITEDKVGVSEGYRLLEEDEIYIRKDNFDELSDIEAYIQSWVDSNKYFWDKGYFAANFDMTYRTKKPPGYFLKKKEFSLPPIPTNIWVRHRASGDKYVHFVTDRGDNMIKIDNHWVDIKNLQKNKGEYEYTVDGVNWVSFKE